MPVPAGNYIRLTATRFFSGMEHQEMEVFDFADDKVRFWPFGPNRKPATGEPDNGSNVNQ